MKFSNYRKIGIAKIILFSKKKRIYLKNIEYLKYGDGKLGSEKK